MIYIKNIFVVSLINNKFLAILTCINKDLFIILPITKIYIYLYKHKIKKKKKYNIVQAQGPNLAKMAPTKK